MDDFLTVEKGETYIREQQKKQPLKNEIFKIINAKWRPLGEIPTLQQTYFQFLIFWIGEVQNFTGMSYYLLYNLLD